MLDRLGSETVSTAFSSPGWDNSERVRVETSADG